MIIECNGIPGCGKTSLIEALSCELERLQIHYRVIGVRTFRDYDEGFKKYIVITKRLFSVIRYPALLFYVLFPDSKYKSVPFLTFKERLITALYFCYLKKEYKQGDVLILSDEGLVQTLTTISEFTSFSNNVLAKYGDLISDNRMGLDCEIPTKISMERIALRNRTDSAIDYLSEEYLGLYISQFCTDLNTVRKLQKNHIIINMCESNDFLARKIINEMGLKA